MNPIIGDLHRKNMSAILRAMADKSQAHVAQLIGVSEATLSRMKDTDIEKLAALLAACDLVAVPRTHISTSPERMRALEVLAREALDASTGGVVDSGWGSLK